MTTKSTAPKIAKKASSVLSSSSTGKASKSAAGSALAQVNPVKTTSKTAATAASKVLRDGRSSSASKSAAGSALSQATAKKGSVVSSATSLAQRTVKSAPKNGSFSRAATRQAVTAATNSKKK